MNQAMLVETRFASLKLLEKELTQANFTAPKTVENPCFVSIEFENKVGMSAYIVSQNVYLTDCHPLISIDSPLG